MKLKKMVKTNVAVLVNLQLYIYVFQRRHESNGVGHKIVSKWWWFILYKYSFNVSNPILVLIQFCWFQQFATDDRAIYASENCTKFASKTDNDRWNIISTKSLLKVNEECSIYSENILNVN